MHAQRKKIRVFTQLTDDAETINHITVEIPLDLDNWAATPKSKLELIIEQSIPPKKSFLPNPEVSPEYKHLILLDIEDAANEVLDIVTKRYMMFRRTLSNENKIKLDQILKKFLESKQYKNTELTNELKSILNDDQASAFKHIKNTYSSIKMTIFLDKEFGGNLGVKMLCACLHELYSGDQRFFKEQIKTRSEVAKEGGLARKDRYSPTKQKACELLNTLTPREGWAKEIDAFNSILPEVEKYMMENNIKYPALASIKKTLRDWIKKDPIVSAAVRIAQPSIHNSPD